MINIEINTSPLRISQAWQGKRFKTQTYKKWQTDVLRLLKPTKKLTGKLEMTVLFYIKNDKMSDIDNFFKTLQDTLVLAGVIEDDRHIYAIHAYKYHSKEESIKISIKELCDNTI